MDQATRDKNAKSSRGLDNIPKFLKILVQIVEDKAYQDLISWSQDGKAIVIKNPVEFAEKLLPIYFKHSNYASFVRQLNLYNFRKKRHYPYDNTFAHTMFLKGRKDLLKFIKRKGNNAKLPETPSVKIESGMNEEGEYEDLMGENVTLKKVHEEMLEKIETLEHGVKNLAAENEKLQQQYMQKKQNEYFLKKVVNKLAKIHGTSAIRELIESVAYESAGNALNAKQEPKKNNESDLNESYMSNLLPVKRTSSLRSNYEFSNPETSESPVSKSADPTALFFRTISSVSTQPELNQSFDYYHNFDQIIDHEASNQNGLAEMGFNAKVNHFEDEVLSYFADNRRELDAIPKNQLNTNIHDFTSSSHLDKHFFMK